MASSLVKIDVHLIFHVKSTSVCLRNEDLPRVFAYIGGIIRTIGGVPIIVGGTSDHIHILSSLPATLSLADFVRIIKTNSSKWIKSLDVSYGRFAWQDGYGAFSVSPSILSQTIDYIKKQQEHHRKITFEEEYRAFLDAYHIEYDSRYYLSD